jgi:endosialidase-like protein
VTRPSRRMPPSGRSLLRPLQALRTFKGRVGNSATADFDGSFVYGDFSTSTAVTAGAMNRFVVRAVGGTIFYSNSNLTAGVSLAPGAGAWADVSDVNLKEHFRDVNGEDVLDKLARMPIREWSYKAQNPSIRHLGPTAQDFYAAFRLGGNDKTITTTDIAGINLLAVQALERRTREVAALRAQLADLERRLARLEAAAKP